MSASMRILYVGVGEFGQLMDKSPLTSKNPPKLPAQMTDFFGSNTRVKWVMLGLKVLAMQHDTNATSVT